MRIQATPKPMDTQTPVQIKMVQYYDEHWYKIEYNQAGVLKTDFFASVTTKLGVAAKPYIARWRGDVGNREADLVMFEAAQRGKRIHAAWQTFTTQGLVIYNPWERPIFSKEQIAEMSAQYNGNIFVLTIQDEMLHVIKLFRFAEKVKPKFLHAEKTLYSLTNKDAGTADNIAYIEEGTYAVNGSTPLRIPAGYYIMDLKTGKTVEDDAYLQTACYLKCAEEMGLYKFNGTIILHTNASTRSGIEGFATDLHLRDEVEAHYEEYRVVADLWTRRNKRAAPKIFEFPATLHLDHIAA